MTTNCSDVFDVLCGLLGEAGYTFHDNVDDAPGTVDDDESRGYWFAWAAPGMADCETGVTHAEMTATVCEAAAHWFEHARIPVDVMDCHTERIRPMEAALKVLVANAPEESPELDDYDDTESAFNNGSDCAAYAAGEVARRGLAGLMPDDQGTDILAGRRQRPAASVRAAT